jgi:hypothetical protein
MTWYAVSVPRGRQHVAMVLTIAMTLLAPGAAKVAAAPGASEAAGEPVATTASLRQSSEVGLAAALVDALNQGEEDAVVALFDPEATLHMERYAWLHYQIRQWARAQIAAGIVIEPEGPFQAVPNHALWTARVQRDDWRQRGVDSVRLANQILTEGDRILDFSADLLDGATVAPLGDLWRPGSPPDPIPRLTRSHESNQTRPQEQAAVGPLALPLMAVFSPLILGAAYRRRSRALRGAPSRALVAGLGAWQCGRRKAR